MNFNDLLLAKGVDPKDVLVFRHRPPEPELRKVLPWLAAERPSVFNAYQQTHGEKVERALTGASYVASFIGTDPGKALFVGLYSVGQSKPLTNEEYWQVPEYIEMKKLGMQGVSADRASVLWFDLALTELYALWKGKLTIAWPPPERSWWRRAHKNIMPVLAILEDSGLDATMPDWKEIDFTWEELSLLPTRWRATLRQWRAIYYIFDTSAGKGYVGSAYGASNLLGRWLNYGTTGHGGNSILQTRDSRHFRFTILQRVSPDMDVEDVIQLEGTWKERLHTRAPYGFNDN